MYYDVISQTIHQFSCIEQMAPETWLPHLCTLLLHSSIQALLDCHSLGSQTEDSPVPALIHSATDPEVR